MPSIEHAPREHEPFSVEQFLMKGVGYKHLENVVTRLEGESDGAAYNTIKRQLRRLMGENETWLSTYRMTRGKATMGRGEQITPIAPLHMPDFPPIEDMISGVIAPPIVPHLTRFADEQLDTLPMHVVSSGILFGDFRIEEIEELIATSAQSLGSRPVFAYENTTHDEVLLAASLSPRMKAWFVANRNPNRSYVASTLAFHTDNETVKRTNAITDRWNAQQTRMRECGYTNL